MSPPHKLEFKKCSRQLLGFSSNCTKSGFGEDDDKLVFWI